MGTFQIYSIQGLAVVQNKVQHFEVASPVVKLYKDLGFPTMCTIHFNWNVIFHKYTSMARGRHSKWWEHFENASIWKRDYSTWTFVF